MRENWSEYIEGDNLDGQSDEERNVIFERTSNLIRELITFIHDVEICDSGKNRDPSSFRESLNICTGRSL